ncbi:hypothetical protein Z517_04495 [Fonsecaea pedrosoi CBS 271.37]|uniref:RING-type domain-containing protein n=1 Tax=Fonsecaea pedrosoi CBS 271.37 TaxID=1442368 RepID=A0A0D2GSG7_9EURO|nr:uncharacterized protein Z517_04495 [Fonsecaea pedrosoi CBS 271.37]KIW81470.1 hypothetical protein Z517_04495 [Fonsecaea pedrosoi CBS 271.37]
MAAVALDTSLTNVLNSLDLDKVPEKLKCTRCHNFNLNPYKTSCCDVGICEACFSTTRGSSCPKCEHRPFTDDICKPSKAMQKTIKVYLKAQEKTRVDERAKSVGQDEVVHPPDAGRPVVNGGSQTDGVTAEVSEERRQEDVAESEDTLAGNVQPSIEEPDPEPADNDDDIDIQVEAEDENLQPLPTRVKSTEDTPQPTNSFDNKPNSQDVSQSNTESFNSMDFSNMMNGFGNMDYNQMMQMMSANGMGFNPMMGMPMGMNPMSAGMFGGFGGPNGGMNMNGMNGMNMAMNYNANQGMYGWEGQNNNMWQNNNANAFSNGMGNDFGSNYGFNMGPSGNFQQPYTSGDFQNGYYGRGYGRGRGRGRGGFVRGRGNFNQFSQYHQQGYQNLSGQKQFDSRNVQSHTMQAASAEVAAAEEQHMDNNHDPVDDGHEDDDFAPGGQEEVQEALGEDYQKPITVEKTVTTTATSEASAASGGDEVATAVESQPMDESLEADKVNGINGQDDGEKAQPPVSETMQTTPAEKPIPEAYNEDLQGPMPPPSAPLGPSAQYGDHGFRSRGHGRFSSRGRGSISMPNGHIAPTVKSFPQIASPMEPKGVGVIGAPTGPRAMREAAVPGRPPSRPAAAGFQIMGRASMSASQRSESRDVERSRSKTPDKDRDRSRRQSVQDKHSNLRYEGDEQDESDYRDSDKPSRKSSRRGTYDDYDRNEREASYAESDSGDYKSSSRRSRGDKERASKQHSSRSSRRRHDEDVDEDHEMDDYAESTRSTRDGYEAESKSRHRSSKSSRHDGRDRDRDRDRDRNRDRDRDRERDHDRDRDRDRDREKTRTKDRDREHRDDKHRDRDRDRKRSRHDRHREDVDKHQEYDYDYDQQQDEVITEEPESRHRSRRHKKDHRRDVEDSNGLDASMVNGRSQSHRSSGTVTPAPAQSMSASGSAHPEEKDPHTLEREARNRERMLKEQQRREKAAKQASSSGGGGTSGRRVTYKYEDDLERGLVEGERESHGRRWR